MIMIEVTKMTKTISMHLWGKDHWSTLMYLDTLVVDGQSIDIRRMRCDKDLHPQFAHSGSFSGKKYPTRLRNGELENHDDWSCFDDAEACGLIKNEGTGINRQYKFTELGHDIVQQLRVWKENGGTFATFEPFKKIKPELKNGDVRRL